MKAIQIFIIVFSTLTLLISCQKDLFDTDYQPGNDNININPNHPMKDSLQFLVNKYISDGIPGAEVVVKNNDGWFYYSGGYAEIESQKPFRSGDAAWLFSITKTYTATLVMLQIEENKINPDSLVSAYLPEHILSKVSGHEKITVRMLLNHTSGIVNVTELPEFVVGQLNNPLNQPSVAQRLEMLNGKPLVFEPGTDFLYSNTNYLLLQLILESVTEKSYWQLLEQEILEPLELTDTYYHLSEQQTLTLGFPNYYFDRHANEQLENITRWNNALANASDGYGALAATPANVIRFHEALLNGELISESSLEEMQNWIEGVNSTEPEYGEGFEYWQFNSGSSPQFGHEGDGIGCSTQFFYVPDNDTYMYINMNAGRQLYGPYLFKITDMKRDLCRYVANWEE
jgi:D-alanyl-D-alanine carboxypeptidase